MIGYSVSSPVTLHYGEQIKKVPAVPDLLRPPIHCIQTGNGDELKRVRQYFDQAHPGQGSRYVQVIPLNELARWPYFPSWLGRRPGPESLDKIDETCRIGDQLAAMKARYPGRKHYRLLLYNGFEHNLGDTIC